MFRFYGWLWRKRVLVSMTRLREEVLEFLQLTLGKNEGPATRHRKAGGGQRKTFTSEATSEAFIMGCCFLRAYNSNDFLFSFHAVMFAPFLSSQTSHSLATFIHLNRPLRPEGPFSPFLYVQNINATSSLQLH